ncbi:MAG TPA: hypothetical protein DCY98_08135 [Nitrospinae bacterium]|nr:hypothetical protein [Nitrospinota bacterium]
MAEKTITLTLKAKDGASHIVQTFQRTAERSFQAVHSASTWLSKSIFSLKSAFIGLAGIAGIGFGIKSFIEESNKGEKALTQLRTALGYTSKDLIAYAKSLSSSTVFAGDAIIGAESLIAAFVKDERQIKSATKATLDLASAKGMDLASAADLVAKTLGTDTNALSRYGIEVKGAIGSNERLLNLINGISKAYGGQAEALRNTGYGGLLSLQNSISNVQQTLGDMLKQILGPWANQLSEKIAAASDELEKFMSGERWQKWAAIAGAYLDVLTQGIIDSFNWLRDNGITILKGVYGAVKLIGDAFHGWKIIIYGLASLYIAAIYLPLWKVLNLVRGAITGFLKTVNFWGILDEQVKDSERIWNEQRIIIDEGKQSLLGYVETIEGLVDTAPDTKKHLTDIWSAVTATVAGTAGGVDKLADKIAGVDVSKISPVSSVKELQTEISKPAVIYNDVEAIKKSHAAWNQLTKAKKAAREYDEKLAEEAKKLLTLNAQFYQEAGVVTDQYYQEQINKLVEQGQVWEEMGIERVEVEKWVTGEIIKLSEQRDGQFKDSAEKQKAWYEGMQDYTTALSAISSGSLSGIAGLFGEAGKLIGGIIELISNIGKLPDMLKAGLKGLVDGARGFGKAIVTIIKDIIVNLPSILYEIITSLLSSVGDIIDALIEGIPKFFSQIGKVLPSIIKSIIDAIITIVSKVPELIYEIVNGIWEGIKALFVGGEITSAITDTWNDQAKPVTVELDTSGAMQALKYAQDALLGAVNETDRAVAREALLSARQAAILAEKQKQDANNVKKEAERKTLKGIFGYLGDLFGNLWESLKSIFSGAWEGLKNILGSLWEGFKNILGGAWEGLKQLLDSLLGAIGNLWEGFKNILGGAWEGLKQLLDSLLGAIGNLWEGFKNILGGAWEGLKALLDSLLGAIGNLWEGLKNIFTDAWEGLKNIFTDAWEGLKSAVGLGGGGSGLPGIGDVFHGFGLWHEGGLLKKAHSGMYLKDDEVPIIAQVGEGILNKYNGIRAIGGEAGLNYANRYGSLPNSGKTENNITYHQQMNFEVVVDKDGNVLKLTRTQARNLARTLDPMFKEMQRNGELSFA